MPHGLLPSRRRDAVLALITLAVLGLSLSAAGGAVAAAQPAISSLAAAPQPGGTLTDGGPACAIWGGRAYCWGENGDGQLGDGNYSTASFPVPVDTTGVLSGKTLTQISADEAQACALDTTGTAYCWGNNQYGQLGSGPVRWPIVNSDVPVRVYTRGVLAGKKLVQISVGELETCALDSTGHAYCWGLNTDGELGRGNRLNSDIPRAVDTSGALAGKTLTQIAAGTDYACAVDTAGAAYCWGDNSFGALGDGNTANSSVPVAVETSGVLAGQTLTQIAAGNDHTCALDTAGAAYCWGLNIVGDLGDGGFTNSDVPVAVDTSGVLAGRTLTQISAGDQTCALDSNGTAYCWGDNANGELGDGSTTNSDVPVAVNTSIEQASELTAISAGSLSGCSISAAGVYCWGDGNGESPVLRALTPATAVTAVPGNGTVQVSWTGPVRSVPLIPTEYFVGATPDGGICESNGGTQCTIGGLTNGKTYSISVVARVVYPKLIQSPRSAAVSVTPGSGVAFTSDPDATATFGQASQYTVRATGASPAISVSGKLPPGITFTPGAGGTAVLAGTPDGTAMGQYPLTFTANSSAGTATQAFTLTVDRAPTLAKFPSTITLEPGTHYILPVAATGYPAVQFLQEGPLPRGIGFNEAPPGSTTYSINGEVASGVSGTWHFEAVAVNITGYAVLNVTVIVP